MIASVFVRFHGLHGLLDLEELSHVVADLRLIFPLQLLLEFFLLERNELLSFKVVNVSLIESCVQQIETILLPTDLLRIAFRRPVGVRTGACSRFRLVGSRCIQLEMSSEPNLESAQQVVQAVDIAALYGWLAPSADILVDHCPNPTPEALTRFWKTLAGEEFSKLVYLRAECSHKRTAGNAAPEFLTLVSEPYHGLVKVAGSLLQKLVHGCGSRRSGRQPRRTRRPSRSAIC